MEIYCSSCFTQTAIRENFVFLKCMCFEDYRMISIDRVKDMLYQTILHIPTISNKQNFEASGGQSQV